MCSYSSFVGRSLGCSGDTEALIALPGTARRSSLYSVGSSIASEAGVYEPYTFTGNDGIEYEEEVDDARGAKPRELQRHRGSAIAGRGSGTVVDGVEMIVPKGRKESVVDIWSDGMPAGRIISGGTVYDMSTLTESDRHFESFDTVDETDKAEPGGSEDEEYDAIAGDPLAQVWGDGDRSGGDGFYPVATAPTNNGSQFYPGIDRSTPGALGRSRTVKTPGRSVRQRVSYDKASPTQGTEYEESPGGKQNHAPPGAPEVVYDLAGSDRGTTFRQLSIDVSEAEDFSQNLAIWNDQDPIVSATIADNAAMVDTLAEFMEASALDATMPPIGWAAVHYAAQRGANKALAALLSHGADATVTCIHRRNTPLHWAAAIGDPDGIKLLLLGGASVEATNVDGSTPLHLAAMSQSAIAYNILLSAGADDSTKTRFGVTADLLAKRRGIIEFVPGEADGPIAIDQQYLDVASKRRSRATSASSTGSDGATFDIDALEVPFADDDENDSTPTWQKYATRPKATPFTVKIAKAGHKSYGFKFGGPTCLEEAELKGMGVVVTEIRPDTPAAFMPECKPGLEVLTVNGVDVSGTVDLAAEVYPLLMAGTGMLELTMVENKVLFASYTGVPFHEIQAIQDAENKPDREPFDVVVRLEDGEISFGFELGAPANEAEAEFYGRGVFIIGARAGSPADRNPDIFPGLQVLQLNQTDLTFVSNLEEELFPILQGLKSDGVREARLTVIDRRSAVELGRQLGDADAMWVPENDAFFEDGRRHDPFHDSSTVPTIFVSPDNSFSGSVSSLNGASDLDAYIEVDDAEDGGSSMSQGAKRDSFKLYSTALKGARPIVVSLTLKAGETSFGIRFNRSVDDSEDSPSEPGCYIVGIRDDTPAAKHPQVREGQQVLRINGVNVQHATDLQAEVYPALVRSGKGEGATLKLVLAPTHSDSDFGSKGYLKVGGSPGGTDGTTVRAASTRTKSSAGFSPSKFSIDVQWSSDIDGPLGIKVEGPANQREAKRIGSGIVISAIRPDSPVAAVRCAPYVHSPRSLLW